jgi:hypothetical protein
MPILTTSVRVGDNATRALRCAAMKRFRQRLEPIEKQCGCSNCGQERMLLRRVLISAGRLCVSQLGMFVDIGSVVCQVRMELLAQNSTASMKRLGTLRLVRGRTIDPETCTPAAVEPLPTRIKPELDQTRCIRHWPRVYDETTARRRNSHERPRAPPCR